MNYVESGFYGKLPERNIRIRQLEEEQHQLKWDIRFMDIAKLVSTWSKDPSSKIGALLVRDRRILATGYNGFPKGIADDNRLNVREEKYPLVVHAEMNVLMNALEVGVAAKGATLYVCGLPVCSECAKNIIQAGIRNVVIADVYECPREDWVRKWHEESNPIFKEARCEIRFLKGYYG